MPKYKYRPYKLNQMTIDFGQFKLKKQNNYTNPFKTIKNQMLKRKEKLSIRRKPIHYQKLQQTLIEKLKNTNITNQKQRDEIVMLQKCKSFFQLRTKSPKKDSQISYFRSTKSSLHDNKKRLNTTSCQRKSTYIQKLQNVMKECNFNYKNNQEIKENMCLFGFYCKIMDKRLQGIKNKIEEKERMI